jgi:hypothetical protein
MHLFKKKRMKREGVLYLLIGVVISSLILFQYFPLSKQRSRLVSEVRQVEQFNRIRLGVKCNIFFVEGDQQSIVYEGPSRLVKDIRVEVRNGTVEISKTGPGPLHMLADWLMPGGPQLLNIYVVVKDIRAVKIDSLLENAGSANLSSGRMNFLVDSDNAITIEFIKCYQKT